MQHDRCSIQPTAYSNTVDLDTCKVLGAGVQWWAPAEHRHFVASFVELFGEVVSVVLCSSSPRGEVTIDDRDLHWTDCLLHLVTRELSRRALSNIVTIQDICRIVMTVQEDWWVWMVLAVLQA